MNIFDELMNNIKTFFELTINNNNKTECNILHLVDYFIDNKKKEYSSGIPCCISKQHRHCYKKKQNSSKYTPLNISIRRTDSNLHRYKIKLNKKKYKLQNMKIKI